MRNTAAARRAVEQLQSYERDHAVNFLRVGAKICKTFENGDALGAVKAVLPPDPGEVGEDWYSVRYTDGDKETLEAWELQHAVNKYHSLQQQVAYLLLLVGMLLVGVHAVTYVFGGVCTLAG